MSKDLTLPSLPLGEASSAEAPAKKRKPAKSSSVSDLDPARWREYTDITTDSLWLIPERDKSGAHLGDYHGNFVPQIPYQAMRRFTRQGDVVLDGFLGSGT